MSAFDPSRPKATGPFGEFLAAAPNTPSLEDLLRRVLPIDPSALGAPVPPAETPSSELLKGAYGPYEPEVPTYPPIRGFGYRIPIIPAPEPPVPSLSEPLGMPGRPQSRAPDFLDALADVWNSGVLPETLRSRSPEHRRGMQTPQRVSDLTDISNADEAPRMGSPAAEMPVGAPDAKRTQLSRRERTKEEKEEIRQEFERLKTNTDPNMVVRMEENRIWAIQNNRQVVFNIEDDSSLAGNAPFWRDHEAGYNAVQKYDAIIEREARHFGVAPDLVRGIMYIENADGHRYGGDALAEILRNADTLLPMNINSTLWADMGGVSKEEFADPEKNIRAGVALIKEIQDRISNPTPAKVGSIWQFSGAEVVRDNGVKIENAMQKKLWKIAPDEDLNRSLMP